MAEKIPGDRIKLEGKRNIRDLGGYQTADGRRIRPHRLIRSENLSGLTENDIRILTREYELRTIVDFRTLAEATEKPDPVMEGVNYIHNPVLSEAQMGMTHEEKTENFGLLKFLVDLIQTDPDGPEHFMSDMYAQLVTEEYTLKQYRHFFELLLCQEEGSLLWHCSAGKDRAGTGAILILYALGVPGETIREDYLLTNRYLEQDLERMLGMLAAKIPDPKVLDGVRIMNTARESYLKRLLDTVTETYGSMDEFLKTQMGIGQEERRILRERYLM